MMKLRVVEANFARRLFFVAWPILCGIVVAQDESESLDVVQSCGVDPSVDYRALLKFGPWDDRNYELTAEDLEYLAPNEHELHDPIPAFFRVELREEMPYLAREGPVQYPRSAVPLFQQRHGTLVREITTDTDCPIRRCDK